MTDDAREPPSTLKGRLADVYVPALVSGSLEALSRRLGNRATVDDPLHGRASSLVSLDPLIGRAAAYFAQGAATYRHVASTTGVDRDAAEGMLSMTIGGEACRVPIAVVAERRRLREIELRIYYAPPARPVRLPRSPLMGSPIDTPLPRLVSTVVDSLRTGAIEQALTSFEEAGRAVDGHGKEHAKANGALGAFLAELGHIDVVSGGAADDGRTCCVEVTLTRKGSESSPALLSFERGDTGLVRELRVYWE
ncbi:hypothetical protein AKJ09_10328 [Labilithrix luteola]|uniref:SnoaL-like domain-containing protein n=1 Tax=Labilithrix luteola TaxID=1391654 RepID=A0A0K1QE09_9BACT|nr:hypothetical protein [Labilithrix luteola]AKV03665.1 hypothetical protein AKJ09_10328 [Labilithrix luteola]